MKLNSIATDGPAVPQASTAPNAGGENFRAAYAKVVDERYTAATAPDRTSLAQQEPSRPAKTVHAVHAGDTLSAIARARLAATGAAADAGAVRQGVTQLARANNIRNPDRIYVGQKLDLASLDTASGKPTSKMTNAPAQWEQEDMIPAQGWKTVAAAPAPLPATTPAFPIEEAAADGDSAAITSVAARQVALYEQNAAPASDKPAAAQAGPDIIYKGIAGKFLDAMPIEPSTRADLQRATTIVGNTVAVRSLGLLTGLGGPLGAVAGLIWGVFSSRQIEAAPASDSKPVAVATPVVDAKQTAQISVAEALN